MSKKSNAVETAISVVNMFNATAPGVANLVLLIKRKDGNIDVMPILDEADDNFTDTIDTARTWLQDNPKGS